MTPPKRAWQFGLSDTADSDFRNVVIWTEDRFGEEQARLYAAALRATFASLAQGPSTAGAKSQPELRQGIYSLHVARVRRRARHVVFFRVIGDRRIEIVRVLHDGMGFRRHLGADESGEI